MFYFEEIFKSTSKEDADLFYCEEKFRSTSREDVDLFLFWRKRVVNMQIIDIQKRDNNNCIKTIIL